MNDCTPLHRLRCLLVWAVVTALGVGLVAALAAELRPDPRAGFEGLVVTAAAWALCSAAVWASAVAGVVAVEAARAVPGPVAPRAVPVALRRVLLRACGVALTGGLATGLAIAPAPAHSGTQLAPPPPAGPVAPPAPAPAPGPDSAHVTTHPGDSLWRVAEARLRAETGQEPSDAQVAAYWPRIHAANRVLLGPDPDFVLPGVPLQLPATADTAHEKEQS